MVSLGNDGLTDEERADLLASFRAGPGSRDDSPELRARHAEIAELLKGTKHNVIIKRKPK